MTDKLIALVDGSLYSASVCHLAAWAAERLSAPVEVLHVLGRREAPEQQDLSGSIRLGARTALMNELADLDQQRSKLAAQHGRAILEDAQAILTDAGIDAVTTRLRHGDLVDATAEIEEEAQLLLIGKRGVAADYAQDHLGSNLERLVRSSKQPVLVASRAFTPIKKVLIAYDGGPSARKAIGFIAQSDLFKGLELHLVTVGDDTPETMLTLKEAQSTLKAAGLSAEIAIHPGQPDSALGALVQEQGFEMVVMGAYGHSRIRRLIIGSTTSEMIRTCKVPILLLR